MQRILLEALGVNRYGGTRTAILNTIKWLPYIAPRVEFVVFLSQFEDILSGVPQIKQIILPTSNRFIARVKLQMILPLAAIRLHVDLVHFTKHLMVSCLPCPRVVTIYDLIALRFPETQSWVDVAYWRWIQPAHVRRASRVIAASQNTAQDLAALYRISPQRIRVVPLAVDERFLHPVESGKICSLRSKYKLPDNYILFVGILAKKKNLRTLLYAMHALHQAGYDAHLVIAGRVYPQSDASSELNLIGDLRLEHSIHYLGEVPDEDLPALYAGARVFVMPSLHEGFGIPCWEAMAVGTPVVASRRGALPEVVGDAGILVDDPLNVDEWVKAIQQCLEDDQLRARLIERGYQQVRGRTWRTVAAETFAVYQEVCPVLRSVPLEHQPEFTEGVS